MRASGGLRSAHSVSCSRRPCSRRARGIRRLRRFGRSARGALAPARLGAGAGRCLGRFHRGPRLDLSPDASRKLPSSARRVVCLRRWVHRVLRLATAVSSAPDTPSPDLAGQLGSRCQCSTLLAHSPDVVAQAKPHLTSGASSRRQGREHGNDRKPFTGLMHYLAAARERQWCSLLEGPCRPRCQTPTGRGLSARE